CYYDLVIEVAIVRPGPITGGMVHPYLRRRCGEEPIDYPHPDLVPVLEKTLGIPLFQEQVMKLAVVAADYSPGEADQLRRDMAAWRSQGKLTRHRERLISRMTAKGIDLHFAERVFEQIRGFGEYGFPESHAASFALITYATAYLKCHFPTEFTCALLNSLPMGFYSAATVIEDARRNGVKFLPICALASSWECRLERGAVRMGARFVKGLREKDWQELESLRPLAGFEELVLHSRLDRRALEGMAQAGVFDRLGLSRRSALWDIRQLIRRRQEVLVSVAEDSPAFRPLRRAEQIAWDCTASSHSTRGHPLEQLRPALRQLGLPEAMRLNAGRDGSRARYAGLVICRQRPSTARGTVFMTLEDETGFVNVVLWPQVFERYAVMAKTLWFLGVSGRLQSRHGVSHLIAERLWAPKVEPLVERVTSRDFH
ncbi:MAG: error-prone DNA polymerase, partial [Candidatus Eremiobacteraeota bacterium]|nr:error-prone DNA polymerase [Candidatus Eremiobacteraeota bacterium]